MPLVIMAGVPCSGKTTCASTIAHAIFATCGKQPVLINEESLLIDKSAGYKDSKSEKMTRGALKAAVERHISKDVFVILDSLNYIKGFRYELYCIARAIPTPHCVIHCDTPLETCKTWNEQRPGKIDASLLEELACRFETPSDSVRWDRPLFHVIDPSAPPVQAVVDALVSGIAPTPVIATQPALLTDTNFLHDLDRVTQEVVSALIVAQASNMPGDPIKLPKSTKPINLRRQFLKISQLHPPPASEVADAFLSFVEKS